MSTDEAGRPLKGSQIAGAKKSLVDALRDAVLSYRRKSILVLGFSGAGKTSLLTSLFGAIEPEEDRPLGTSNVRRYIFRLGEIQFRTVDTPGHVTLSAILDEEIDALVSGQYQGVINLVSFGFNESRRRQLSEAAGNKVLGNRHQPVGKDGHVNNDYVRLERQLELDYLRKWVKLVGPDSGLKWIITVANKSDLWAKSSSEALDYYAVNGDYGRLLRESLEENGVQDVKHDVRPMVSDRNGWFFDRQISEPLAENALERQAERLVKLLHERLAQ